MFNTKQLDRKCVDAPWKNNSIALLNKEKKICMKTIISNSTTKK